MSNLQLTFPTPKSDGRKRAREIEDTPLPRRSVIESPSAMISTPGASSSIDYLRNNTQMGLDSDQFMADSSGNPHITLNQSKSTLNYQQNVLAQHQKNTRQRRKPIS